MNNSAYEARVRQLESEGMNRSDAQSVADAEVMRQADLVNALKRAFDEGWNMGRNTTVVTGESYYDWLDSETYSSLVESLTKP